MDTKSKFLRFGFGFLLGVFLLLIMFGDRDFSCIGKYFPEGRVLDNISKKEIVFSTNVPDEKKIIRDTAYFKHIFLNNATVDFNRSNPQKEPCGEYIISNDTIEISVKNCRNQVEVFQVK